MHKTIAIVNYNLWSSDGRAKASYEIYKELGYKMEIFTPREEFSPANEQNVHFTFFGSKIKSKSMSALLKRHFQFLIGAFYWLARLCRHNKPILLHIHNMPDYFMLLAYLAKRKKIKVVFDIRDVTPAVWSSRKSDSPSSQGMMYKLMLFVYLWACRKADYVFCADLVQKEMLLNHGIRERKIRVFMNLPLRSCWQTQSSFIPKEPLTVIYHGSINYRLGLDLAVKAIDGIDDPCLHFQIVGDGDFKGELKKIIKNSRHPERFTFIDHYLPIEEIPKIASGAYCAVIPNRITPGTEFMLPHKMLEYMMLGVPVAVPELGIIKRYINEEMAVFYEPENISSMREAILKIARQDREKMISSALHFFDGRYEENKKCLTDILQHSL